MKAFMGLLMWLGSSFLLGEPPGCTPAGPMDPIMGQLPYPEAMLEAGMWGYEAEVGMPKAGMPENMDMVGPDMIVIELDD